MQLVSVTRGPEEHSFFESKHLLLREQRSKYTSDDSTQTSWDKFDNDMEFCELQVVRS